MHKYLLVMGLVLLMGCGDKGKQQGGEENRDVTTEGVIIHAEPSLINKVLSSKDIIVIDVRPAEKYEQGHIPGAINIDLMGDFEDQIKELNAEKVIVYCGDGRRSLKASEILKKYGIDTIFNLKNGFPTWVDAGYPVEQ